MKKASEDIKLKTIKRPRKTEKESKAVVKPDEYIFGRPTSYRPEYAKIAIDMLSIGKAKVQVAAEFSITKETFRQWEERYPDFSAAVKIGMIKAEAWWRELGLKGTMGDIPVQPKLYNLMVANRFKHREDSVDKFESPELADEEVGKCDIHIHIDSDEAGLLKK